MSKTNRGTFRKSTGEPTCKHGHTSKEHPRCFMLEKEVQKSVAKILLLDIETSPISVLCWGLWEQNISINSILQDWHLLSWSAKWLFEPAVYSNSLSPYEASQHDDRRICGSMWLLLDEADIVISHNGDNFDIKRLNTRFLYHGMKPPKAYKSIDTLKVAKEQFNFSSNKLDYINEFLGIPKKDKLDSEVWKRCFEGDEKALKELEQYNRNDAEILEDTYLKLRPYIKGHPNLNLYSKENISICPNCGSSKLEWKGHYYTYTGRYAAFRCSDCGAIGRSRLMDLEPEKRKTIVR